MTELNQGLTTRRARRRSRPQSESVKGITHKVLPVLVLLLTAVLVFAGGRMTFAGMASYQAEAFLEDWAGKAEEPAPRAWAVAHEAAQRAVALYPVANGEYLDRLGRVYSWQQFTKPYGSPEAQASRLAALEGYRASTQARPTWPQTWARLAHTKLQLAQFDDEFRQALAQANELGPTRIMVQREVMTVAFAAWPQLNASERERVLQSARLSVIYSIREAQRIYQMALHAGITEPLCESLDPELQSKRRVCQFFTKT